MDSTEDGTENAMQQSTSFIKGKTALPAVTRKSAGTYMNVVSGLVHQNKENIAEQNGKSDNQQFKTLGELDLNRPTPSQLRKSQTPSPVETSVSKACQTQLPPRDFPAGPCSTTSSVESGLVILSEEFYDNLWRLVREDKLCVPTHDKGPFCGPSAMDNQESTINDTTTTEQAKKEQDSFAEGTLHPRWISIQRSQSVHPKYDAFRRTVAVAVGDRLTDLANFQPLLGDIWTCLDSENVSLLREQTIYLHNCGASEAQWEPNVWREWFLKGTKLAPCSKLSTS